MCGICGKINKSGVSREEMMLMNNMLVHRGPDDEGYYIKGPVGLGHRRLSIIDLEGGKQPICNEDQSVWIVCNGEVYNYRELRAELINRGHTFRTRSDTEVIIHLFEEYGDRCVERLSGMYAFAIWDEKNQKLLLARDRLGQKPVFYLYDNNIFHFASEIKSILTGNEVDRDIDYESVHHYFSLRFIPSPGTMFHKIKKLPPAHILVFQKGKVRLDRYWDIDFNEKLLLSDNEYIECLDEHLTSAIESHLVSDVDIGAFLSGGMDTSMVVAVMGCLLKSNFKTFAIGVEEDDFNELPYARMVASQYKTDHVEELVKADLVTLLTKMIWHMDEPSDPIAACMFHGARLASHHVKVVMGGDGGDELFAGFDRYAGLRMISYYRMIPDFVRKSMIAPLVDMIPDSFTYKSATQKMRWVNQLSFFEDGERYAEATAFFRFNHSDKAALFHPDIWNRLKKINSTDVIVQQYDKPNAEDQIDKMLYADFMTRLPEHTLMLTDRMNMAHSLEARSPFLDHALVETLAKFPSTIKIRNRTLKYVLRKLGERYLQSEILSRKKQGFMFPVAYWFRNELYDFVTKMLLESHFVKEGIFRKEKVKDLIESHRSNKIDNHVRIWMLLNMEIWHRLFIERMNREEVEDVVLSVYNESRAGA